MTVDALSNAARVPLPQGVVTFLFTDIEGSTRLLQRLGDDYSDVLMTHHRLLREVLAAHHGHEVDTEGDAFFVAFSSPREAVAAAVEAQRVLHEHPWPQAPVRLRVRMGLHTGEPVVVDDNYVGIDVHRAARIAAAGHGGQVVISQRLRELLGDHLPDGVSLRDLGEHRLKDLPEPEHLLQVDIDGLPQEFPPLKSLHPPTNVPHPTSTLVGRRHELAELRELLLRPGVRLVTVTGPGGAGKTRLAAAVALELRDDFPHGVYFVDLAPVTRAELVVPTIARVLQVPLDGDASAEEAVARHVGEQRLLLLLDNLEQVVEGAPAVGRLVHSCPGLTVLGTSRFLLALDGEQEYAVPPMRLPEGRTLAEVGASEAVTLFVERAGRARRGFALTAANAAAVARICELVDGLPLAIELAAARTRLFRPEMLVERLGDRLSLLTGGSRDAPERHRTLRATIDWSYTLLPEAERRLFLELAVFHAPARIESIEAVVGDEVDVVDQLTALIDHSLAVQQEQPDNEVRFGMLQTVRDYALSRLEQEPRRLSDLRLRHAQHFLDLVRAGVDPAHDGAPVSDQDYDDIRAALTFWLDDGSGATSEAGLNALRMAGALGDYWYHHGLLSEGSGWLERALAAVPEPPADAEARALRELGIMREQRQDLDRAAELLTRAMQLYREMGDRAGEAKCLNSLGVVARSAGRPDDAEAFFRRGVALRKEVGDPSGIAAALNNLGIVHLDRGDWPRARVLFTETLAIDRAAGNDWGVACTSVNFAGADIVGGRTDEAAELLRTAIGTFREVGDPDGLIESVESSSGVALLHSDWVAAARLVAAAAAARELLDLPGSPADHVLLDGWVEQVRAALDPTAFAAARAEGAAMTLDQAADYALGEVLAAQAPPESPSGDA
ncbi:ATP-binding protein [Nocardioides mesophilus]|uniref:Tetratricopeptide repeat protein n=1 Tax=Nocardioides mesophilus TaxID=433659 RepID=A0A7G9RBG8_9ACTN|nr:tetratricopeptide repeat protein [Nocardioides mesophilus]QNN52943.1 tetratricopeptide repeat protein [Nocardioides mesophilus]